jgi:GNAT superfamily N-acetyltransferase
VAGLEIHPLSELRSEAAGLLAGRFAAQRAVEPLLPEVEDFEPHLPDDGVVATRGGRCVAFLGGEVEDEDTAWVRFAGCAATDAEAMRDLFAVMAERWGVTRFQVTIPASDELLRDAFFRLAFGCQAFWAVREPEAPQPIDFGGTIRPSVPDDLEALAGFDELLWMLLGRSPSFSGRTIPSRDEFRKEWSTLWEETDQFPAHVVAERDGRIVGHTLLFLRPEGDLRVPAGNIDLAHAVTLDDVRGSGVGLALTAWALRYAEEHGYRSMTTDWRGVNLLASRFWPRRGFRPQYLRLYRAVP